MHLATHSRSLFLSAKSQICPTCTISLSDRRVPTHHHWYRRRSLTPAQTVWYHSYERSTHAYSVSQGVWIRMPTGLVCAHQWLQAPGVADSTLVTLKVLPEVPLCRLGAAAANARLCCGFCGKWNVMGENRLLFSGPVVLLQARTGLVILMVIKL